MHFNVLYIQLCNGRSLAAYISEHRVWACVTWWCASMHILRMYMLDGSCNMGLLDMMHGHRQIILTASCRGAYVYTQRMVRVKRQPIRMRVAEYSDSQALEVLLNIRYDRDRDWHFYLERYKDLCQGSCSTVSAYAIGHLNWRRVWRYQQFSCFRFMTLAVCLATLRVLLGIQECSKTKT